MFAVNDHVVGTCARVAQSGAALAIATIGTATMAPAATLSFDSFDGVATGSTVIGRSQVIESTTARFRSVATDQGKTVDALISTTVKHGTDFGDIGGSGRFGDPGFIPDYQPWGSDTAADLGFLYYGNGINGLENGILVEFTFFDGTGDLAGTFDQMLEIAELNFAIYDVDGESIRLGNSADQTEFFSAFVSDGLTSFQLGDTPQALTAEQRGDAILFSGPDKNFSESDASGAVILNYENTSQFRLDFGSVQSSGPYQNGVFSAFDGDLSLIAQSDFSDPVTPVPAPAALTLLLGALGGMRLFKRKKPV